MENNNENKKTAVALGNFDGVHLGHRRVLRAAAEKLCAGLMPLAVVFEPHPLKMLGKPVPELLCEGAIRERLFEEIGVKLYTLNFVLAKDMDYRDFFKEILLNELNAAFISVGYNYKFGKNRSGDTEKLRELCDEVGIELFVAEEVKLDNINVSSTNIRNAMKNGEITLANRMLGREFSYDFTVVSGDKRGRLLGAPTINQFFPEGFMVPKYGVYASRAFAYGKWYVSVTNIGLRPTVGTNSVRSETCLLGFSGDLYSQNVEVRLVEYLRPEVKFVSFEELKKQIAADALSSEKIAEKYKEMWY